MSHQPASTALARYTVLDLTRVRAGPTCVRQLADWGANVIKIEMPAAVEGKGALGGRRDGPDFQNLHRNKRSITLNLKEPDGVAILKKLIEKSDVIVENYRPDVKERLGIDYETLSAINTGLIYASISGFGQDGPYKGRPGFDQIAQGMGGLMSITGLPGQGPVRVGIPIADLCAGLFAAQGIMIALLEREQSGKGQWVQSSLLQSQVFMLDFQAARWTVEKEIAPQAGNNHPTSIPTGVFETTDGHINIASAGQAIYERFCKAVDAEHLITNPDFIDGEARSKNRDALNEEINAITRDKDSQTWVDLLNEAGVPCGPIYSIDQVFEDPQIQHLGAAESVYSPDRDEEIELVAQAIKLSRTPSKLKVGPPKRGEHTDEVLKEFGYSDDQIEDFLLRTVV
ncbi:MAG: Succinyl-CoA--L-malate CoA-transferase beta subunit [Alphaproteobacteria bacterium MarineAlpha4_Bin2]|nr:MAG: Succinyl-CoA--L-malate CoA-transferase beta subunit [Alphaproteobacteria bacterium MarineAlpha4_Bin2]